MTPLRLARVMLLLPPLVFALLALYGCGATAQPQGPRLVVFEAEGFMVAYMKDRDTVIRQTAASVLRCEKVTAESPLAERQKCEKVKAAQEEWARRDAIVYKALVTGSPVSSFDWEKAAEAAGTFIGTAAGSVL